MILFFMHYLEHDFVEVLIFIMCKNKFYNEKDTDLDIQEL